MAPPITSAAEAGLLYTGAMRTPPDRHILTVEPEDVAGLTATIAGAIPPGPPSVIADIRPETLMAIPPAGIGGLIQTIGELSTAQLDMLSDEQLSGLLLPQWNDPTHGIQATHPDISTGGTAEFLFYRIQDALIPTYGTHAPVSAGSVLTALDYTGRVASGTLPAGAINATTLTPEQARAIPDNEIDTLDRSVLCDIPIPTLRAFRPEQIAQMGNEISHLPLASLRALRDDQLAALTQRQLQGIQARNPAIVPAVGGTVHPFHTRIMASARAAAELEERNRPAPPPPAPPAPPAPPGPAPLPLGGAGGGAPGGAGGGGAPGGGGGVPARGNFNIRGTGISGDFVGPDPATFQAFQDARTNADMNRAQAAAATAVAMWNTLAPIRNAEEAEREQENSKNFKAKLANMGLKVVNMGLAGATAAFGLLGISSGTAAVMATGVAGLASASVLVPVGLAAAAGYGIYQIGKTIKASSAEIKATSERMASATNKNVLSQIQGFTDNALQGIGK